MLKAFILICSQQPAEAAKEALEASAHGPVDQLVEGPQSARQEPVERKVLQHVAHVQHELDHACQEARNGCTLALGHLQVHLRRGITRLHRAGSQVQLDLWPLPTPSAETAGYRRC